MSKIIIMIFGFFLSISIVGSSKAEVSTTVSPPGSTVAEESNLPETILISNSKRPVLLRIYDTSKCKGSLQYMNKHSMGLSECVDPGVLKQVIATWKSLRGYFSKTPNCEPYKKVLCYGESHKVQENTLIVASKELAWASLANPAPAIYHPSFSESGGTFYIKTIKSEISRGICGLAGDLGLFLSAIEADQPDKLNTKDCRIEQKRVEREMKSGSVSEPGVKK